jgi:4-carboxymuconolactone decarboxylase
MTEENKPPAPPEIPEDIAAYIAPYYEASFGEFPSIPKARMGFGAEHRPEFTRAAEETRRIALYDGPLDNKTAQMVAFGYLLNAGLPPAIFHARAARKYGATWEELHQIVEIAFAITNGMSALNLGGEMLARLKAEEAATPAG